MGIKKDILWRVYLAFLLICGFGMAIIVQASRIQFEEGEKWRSMADSLTTSYRTIEAERGNVFSENGSLLATSLPFFEVRMDLNSTAMTNADFYKNVDSLAICMANFFGDKPARVYKRELIRERKAGERYHLISHHVTYPELQKIQSWPLFRKGRYKGGLIVKQENKRVRPFRMLAHRTIGYVREGIQPVGLEGRYDKYLRGKQGKRLMQRIAGGAWVPVNDENEISPKNGKDLMTTLDINLQDVAENALLDAVKKHKADHGCAVVMEVETGKIRAIANISHTEKNTYWESYNHAVGEGLEPGSTFKLASMMSLLEDGYVEPNDSVDLEHGRKNYYDEVMKDAEKHEINNVTVKRAFEISSNVGISKLVNKHYSHNPGQFINNLKKFGLTEKTGIEIKGEPKPFVKSPDSGNWSGITLPWMAVGYELKLTPLQILTFYNAVANDGKMMKPYLVNRVQEYGKEVKDVKPTVLRDQISSDETLKEVQSMLKGVVDNGTASNLFSPQLRIAGKTGTAKKVDEQYGYSKTYRASFVGYFPADDPLYSCIVVINSPSEGGYYGSGVAGPVFREIADKVYSSNINIHQALNNDKAFYNDKVPYAKAGNIHDVQTIYNKLGISYQVKADSRWVECQKKDHSINLKERRIIEGLVPNVTGMSLKDALYLLENSGLQVKVEGSGKVQQQSIMPGKKVKTGRTIKIKLG